MTQDRATFPLHYHTSTQDLKMWASSRLPKLIIFAMAVHLFFSLALVSVLHDHHQQLGRVLVPYEGQDGKDYYYYQARRNMGSVHDQTPVQTITEGKLQVDDTYRVHLLSIVEELKEKLNTTQVISCRWRIGDYAVYTEDCNYHLFDQTSGSIVHDDRIESPIIVLYNPLAQERILCDGSKIKPKGIVVLDEDLSCSEPPRLFPVVPNVENAHEMEPIKLSFNERKPKFEDFPCDVPCQSPPGAHTVAKRIVHGTPWILHFSMEGPQYYGSLRINPKAHLSGRFYSTTSFQSEIPLPYFSWDEYGHRIQAEPVIFDEAIKGAVFMAANCNSRNNREALVKSLMNSTFRVDSVSKCLHNAPKPEGTNNDKVKIMRHYLFYLAFENQCEDDYITEKLWLTYAAGVIPIYFGALNVHEHVPPNSLINVNDFKDTDELVEYLNKVANNRTLYESYHAWREEPLPEAFVKKYNFTHIHSTCRTCRWAYSKKYGLGWEHSTQTLQDSRIPRKVCYNDETSLLTHPFRESWISAGSKKDILATVDARKQSHQCETKDDLSLSMPLYFGNATFQRKVVHRDGVTDLHIMGINTPVSKNDKVILRIETDIQGDQSTESLVSLSDKYFCFQDSSTRMTILSNRSIDILNTGVGTLKLELGNLNYPTQIRIIIEDINTFYDDGSTEMNYFGQLMAADFFNPLEKFVLWGNSVEDNKEKWEKLHIDSGSLIEGGDDVKARAENAFPKTANDPNTSRIDEQSSAAATEKQRLINFDQGRAKDVTTLKAFKKLIESGAIQIHPVERSRSKN